MSDLLDGIVARLRPLYEQSELSDREIGERAGVGMTYVRDLFREKKGRTQARGGIDLVKLDRVCKALGTDLDYVVFGREFTPETRQAVDILARVAEQDAPEVISILKRYLPRDS